ncbi:MAG: redoxin family protein [Planctomycetaceae bacterium]|nr:redoxin family protein [Planctomycetaceae bacterium]
MYRFGGSAWLWTVVVISALGGPPASGVEKENASSASPSAPASAPLALGEAVPSFTFKDIRYLARTLDDFGAKQAYVLAFTSLDCPQVKRLLPKLKALDEAYRGRGVQFLAINVAPADSVVEMAYQAVKADCEFPFVKDFDGAAARAVGADRVGTVVVLDADQKLRYRGGVDLPTGQEAGQSAAVPRETLREAIEAVLEGKDAPLAEAPVDGCLIPAPLAVASPDRVTYSEHVAALFQQHCQECHRPGNTAPFALLSYADAQANAEMIAEVVHEQRMPPCYASREQEGQIVNRRELTAVERATIIAWARGGAPEGDPAKAPAPRAFSTDKWQIGEPDMVITMSKAAEIPAQGYVKYRYEFLPHLFQHDTWVQKIEILPGNPEVVHHANLASVHGVSVKDAEFITGFVPGGDPMVMDPGQGFCIKRGSALVLQIHYVTTGKPATDQTSVGLVFCRGKIDKEIKHFQVNDKKFVIPPGAPHHRVVAEQTFTHPATGIGMFSHMHLRGKDMTFFARYPDGTVETLLAVPNYSFDWQMSYRWDAGKKKFPAGTKIECVAHFDNSPFNPYNPDPTQSVRNGQQTFQEMMYGFFFFTDDTQHLDLEIDPATGRALSNAAEAEKESSGT